MIQAQAVAHSLSPQGEELLSILATFPRHILAEVNTHRMLSKNTSSSRAIPFLKMVEAVKTNPFIPIGWQKNHSGMQGSEYHIDVEQGIRFATNTWLRARDNAVNEATMLNQNCDVTKQLANRLLEPFMWTTMLITGPKSGWDNFFRLRCPSYRVGGKGDVASSTNTYRSKKDAIKDYPGSADEPEINWMLWNEGYAEIHIMALAEAIWDARNESTPKQLKAGEWHIPFEDKISSSKIWDETPEAMSPIGIPSAVKISTAMGARTSYTVVGEEKEVDYQAMIGLHDRLLTQDPPHSSPLEHCAIAMSDEQYFRFVRGEGVFKAPSVFVTPQEIKGWCNNFKGFIPYRYIVDNNLSL